MHFSDLGIRGVPLFLLNYLRGFPLNFEKQCFFATAAAGRATAAQGEGGMGKMCNYPFIFRGGKISKINLE